MCPFRAQHQTTKCPLLFFSLDSFYFPAHFLFKKDILELYFQFSSASGSIVKVSCFLILNLLMPVALYVCVCVLKMCCISFRGCVCLFILSDSSLFCQAIGDLSHAHRLSWSVTVIFFPSGFPDGRCPHLDNDTGTSRTSLSYCLKKRGFKKCLYLHRRNVALILGFLGQSPFLRHILIPIQLG